MHDTETDRHKSQESGPSTPSLGPLSAASPKGSPIRGPTRRRPALPVVRSPPRQQQQQQQQPPSSSTPAAERASWGQPGNDTATASHPQIPPAPAAAGAHRVSSANGRGSGGGGTGPPPAAQKPSGLDALMSAARGQAKAAKAGPPRALTTVEMGEVAA
ncbi:hypothetical protein MNEG_0594, partial [Monoraphidium neglectum]